MMSRYKSAFVLITFLLLSASLHTANIEYLFSWKIIVISLVLVLTYITGTCVNDLADRKIDEINLKNHTDRPLVGQEYSAKELIILASVASILATIGALSVSVILGVLILCALLLNMLYSLPPFKISHRPILAPFYLSFCYVVIPYLAGYQIARHGDFNISAMVAFYFLFLARISLKDFRDRKGDKANGKMTMILKYGKNIVCPLSFSSMIIGMSLLIYISNGQQLVQATLILFLLSLCLVQYRLYVAKNLDGELLSIGYGARMGNGALLVILGSLLLSLQHADTSAIAIFCLLIVSLYAYAFWQYLVHDDFYFGKRKLKT